MMQSAYLLDLSLETFIQDISILGVRYTLRLTIAVRVTCPPGKQKTKRPPQRPWRDDSSRGDDSQRTEQHGVTDGSVPEEARVIAIRGLPVQDQVID